MSKIPRSPLRSAVVKISDSMSVSSLRAAYSSRSSRDWEDVTLSVWKNYRAVHGKVALGVAPSTLSSAICQLYCVVYVWVAAVSERVKLWALKVARRGQMIC